MMWPYGSACRRFRILAIVDDFTRECLMLLADTSLSGLRLGRELDAIITKRGKTAACVSDNGTEWTSTASCAGLSRAVSTGITSHLASRQNALSRASMAVCGTSY
jgi:transposase InsO family protein